MGRKKTHYWIKFDPESTEQMDKNTGWRLTLCRLLKDIYRDTDNEEIKFKCRVAVSIASSLANRITMLEGTRWGKIQYPGYEPYFRELVNKEKDDC